jgi:hypothetical protein
METKITFMDKKDEILSFSLNIENIVKEKGISYIDAILLYCEKTGLETEAIPKLIAGTLKSKIKLEAESLHFLPKSTTRRLPI